MSPSPAAPAQTPPPPAPPAYERFLALAELALDSAAHPWLIPLAQLFEAASRGVGSLDAPPSGEVAQPPPSLIVVDGDQMLLARSAAHWACVRSQLEQRLAQPPQRAEDDQVRQHLNRIVPAQRECGPDGQTLVDNAQQRLAAALLVDAPVGVLTGGPGTGKTTSAAALIALACALDPSLGAEDILICAPTGKAANRLRQSLHGAASRLTLRPAEAAIITALRPITMHRALGWTPVPVESGGPWLHHPGRPLPQRLVVVDEASMADVGLLAALVSALGQQSRLLILGDRDQLDSVEAGGVLAELVQRGAAADLQPAQQALLRARCGPEAVDQWRAGLPPLSPAAASRPPLPGLVAGLRWSYRAKSAPWILSLADLVRPGSSQGADALLAFCERCDPQQITRCLQQRQLDSHCAQAWLALAQTAAAWNHQQLPDQGALSQALATHQCIVATNAQVERANALGQRLLSLAGAQPNPQQPPPIPLLAPATSTRRHGSSNPAQRQGPLLHGTPIMVLANERALDLANGDIGLALGPGPGQQATIACFPNLPQPIPLARLPEHASAHAITIHKSQGSEWTHISIDLPHHAGDLLDRRLLYTAITRSSHHLAIHASPQALRQVLDHDGKR